MICLSITVLPAQGLSVITDNQAVSMKTDYALDTSADLHEKTSGGSGALYQETAMSGTGENSIKKTVSGNGYSVMSAFGALGEVNSKMSTAASDQGAAMNSKTGISGQAGYIASASSTPSNEMATLGWFSGEGGYLSSDTTSIASDRSFVGGSADILGVNCLDGEISNNVASGGDVLMKLDGLFDASSGKLGDFGMLAINNEKSNVPRGGTNPVSTTSSLPAGDLNSYKLAGWRWVDNPNIQLYVKTDTNLAREGLSSTQAKTAISGAAETWDAAVIGQPLFNDNVITSSKLNTDIYDGKNVHAWKSISSSALAYARTYYYTNQKVTGADSKSYYRAIESDVCYNTGFKWSTSGTPGKAYTSGAPIDVQTVALHELGHTLGLGDIYGTNLAWDTSQIMNSYNDVQRTLGAGDITGIQELYGN
jgi:hypothetical protein